MAQLVREHEQADLLPERSDRWGWRQQGWEEPLPSEIVVGTAGTSHPASGAQGQLHGLGLWVLIACFDKDPGLATPAVTTTENYSTRTPAPTSFSPTTHVPELCKHWEDENHT